MKYLLLNIDVNHGLRIVGMLGAVAILCDL